MSKNFSADFLKAISFSFAYCGIWVLVVLAFGGELYFTVTCMFAVSVLAWLLKSESEKEGRKC